MSINSIFFSENVKDFLQLVIHKGHFRHKRFDNSYALVEVRCNKNVIGAVFKRLFYSDCRNAEKNKFLKMPPLNNDI